MQAQAEHSPRASQVPRQTTEDHAAAFKQHKLNTQQSYLFAQDRTRGLRWAAALILDKLASTVTCRARQKQGQLPVQQREAMKLRNSQCRAPSQSTHLAD